ELLFISAAMIHSRSVSSVWQLLTSAGVFMFFALSLALPSGYSYGAVSLLLTALAYFLTRPELQLSCNDKALAYSLLTFFLVALAAFLVHGNEPSTLDQSSRYLLFIPVLFLLL